MSAILVPPLSAVFSPSVRLPFNFVPGVASNEEYSSEMHFALPSNSLLSSGVHQSRRLPLASNFLPSSSKPWVNSCPMTAPTAPKLAASSACLSNWRLQNPGGEIDGIELWIVVSVNGGWRHSPFTAIHGLANLCQLPLKLELPLR